MWPQSILLLSHSTTWDIFLDLLWTYIFDGWVISVPSKALAATRYCRAYSVLPCISFYSLNLSLLTSITVCPWADVDEVHPSESDVHRPTVHVRNAVCKPPRSIKITPHRDTTNILMCCAMEEMEFIDLERVSLEIGPPIPMEHACIAQTKPWSTWQ